MYFFVDIQARGKYPNYALKKFERENLNIKIEKEDLELLKKYTPPSIWENMQKDMKKTI